MLISNFKLGFHFDFLFQREVVYIRAHRYTHLIITKKPKLSHVFAHHKCMQINIYQIIHTYKLLNMYIIATSVFCYWVISKSGELMSSAFGFRFQLYFMV